MNFRTTAILFGLVLVFGLVLLVVSQFSEDTPPSGALVEELDRAGLKAENVDAVEIERGSPPTAMKFVRTGKDAWRMEEPVQARADAAAVEAVVSAVFRARPTEYAELSGNPATQGLAPPSLKVILKAGDKSSTLNVGDITFGGKVAFVTTSTRPRPMAVPASDLTALFKGSVAQGGPAGEFAKSANDYRTKQVFAVDSRTGADDLTQIKVTLPNKKQELALVKTAGGWTFTSPAGWGDAAVSGDTSAAGASAITGVRGLINSIVSLQAGTADDFIDHPGNLADYGLNPDNPDRIRVEIKPKGDAPAEVAFIGRKADPAPPAKPGTPAPPPPPAKVYVQREGSGTVYRIGNPPAGLDGLAALVANPDPLRDRDLVKDADRGRIDAIDLTAGGQTTKLRKVNNDWKLFGGPNDPQEANQEAVRHLIDLITQPHVVKDFPPANDANFAGPELKAEVKFWADAVKAGTDPKAEPKVEGTPTVLQFGKVDTEGVYVRRTLPTGAKLDVRLLPKVKVGGASPHTMPGMPPATSEEVDVVAAVARTRLDFLDAKLKSFSSFQANKLTIQNGAAVTEVVREKASAPGGEAAWKYAKPDAQKGRTADTGAVNDLLTLLATQQAGKFVAEAPAEADLAKWGLDPKAPKLKVTVGLETPAPPTGAPAPPAADGERVYYLGNATADGNSVYARQEGKAAVFTVPKLIFDKFSAADLRDKTVVRFDKAKVKKVSLRGWKDQTGLNNFELVFERKGGTWAVAKSPGKYDLDPAKVDRFLDAVNGLRAKAFVGGPKPDQKLVPEDGGLQVGIELDGAPGVTLFVGTPTDGDASVFVQTSTLPAGENVVTAVADVFKPYKAGPGAFAK
jgi:hypothetical protein